MPGRSGCAPGSCRTGPALPRHLRHQPAVAHDADHHRLPPHVPVRVECARAGHSCERRLAPTDAAFFAIAGWHLPLFPVWLKSRGLDPAAIGIVLAAMQAVRVVATPAGTRIADHYGPLHGAI